MQQVLPIHKLRNIGIIAHIDAGKTTTTERILFYAGVTHQIGEVDDGSTQMDWMDQERERGITITSAATRFQWRGHDINLIDTPGHVDFTAEVERSLRVLDGVIVVLCGVGGVEPQSEMVWHQADRYHIPRVIFVNKMDRLGANFEAVCEEIKDKLGAIPLVMNFPVGASESFRGVVDLLRGLWLSWSEEDRGATLNEAAIPLDETARYQDYRVQLLETVASADDGILAAFLANEEIPREALLPVIRRLTLTGQVVPVFSGASLRDQGIQPLLDAVVDFLPAPDDVAPPVALKSSTGEKVPRPPDPEAPFLGLVFKTHTNRERGRDSYLRIYSGTLREGMILQSPRLKGGERVARLFRVHADKRRSIPEASAGDIVMVSGLKNAATGDTLCEGEPLVLEGLTFPEPVVSAALEARSAGDEEKINLALARMAGDDPTFKVKLDENTGQTIISGMGELHLQVLEEILNREFSLKVRVGRPQVSYRETIKETVESEAAYDRMTGGRQHFASLKLRLSPLQRGKGFRFHSTVPNGRIPAVFTAFIEAACRDATESGILYGYPVVDVGVELIDGTHSELNSSELAYRIAAAGAFRDGCRRASPVLLEPIMSLEIVCPRDFVGGVVGNLASRHGHIIAAEAREQVQILKAQAPLSQMFGYTTDLRSASQGRATYSMIFSHFAEVADPGAFLGG